ncbi:MAG: hypothetical protein K6E50_14625 [Lachnospiraceae bacterium]|nr:hypothetical protein [Lachnospiraceae bacterium]
MRSELSAWNYVRNNKRSSGTLIMALALVFVAMYLISMLLLTTTESFLPVVREMPKKLAYLSVSAKSLGVTVKEGDTEEELQAEYENKRNELIEKLKKVPGIENAYYTQIIVCLYQSVMGQIVYENPLIAADDVPRFLKHVEAELVEGSLPAADGEVLVDRTIMKNRGYRIGGYFMEEAYGKTFRICGVISSPGMVCVGTPMGYTNSGWYIVTEKEETVRDMTAVLNDLGIVTGDADKVIDTVDYETLFERDFEGVFGKILKVIYLVVMVFLAFTVLIAYIAHMRGRMNEYCLYMSIGYGRSAVYGMMMREMLIIFGGGAIIGLVVALSGGALMQHLLIEARGLSCRVIMPEQIFYILASYCFIIGILQIPVVLSINTVRTIDAIEE